MNLNITKDMIDTKIKQQEEKATHGTGTTESTQKQDVDKMTKYQIPNNKFKTTEK